MLMTPFRLCSAALLSSALLLSGCGSNNGSGTPPTPYAINGTLFGMKAGTSLTLANTVNGDTLNVSSNGSFQLGVTVFDNDAYNVTVATHPFNQTCTVSNGSGTVDEDNVTGINVHCVAAQFNIGGTVSGLTGTLLLQNNNGDDLTLTANGTFTFSAPVTAGSAYLVGVQSQPANQTCTVSNGNGTASGTHVSNVAVVCVNNTTPRTVGGAVTGLNGTLVVQNNFGNNTTLTANGAFTFSSPLNNGSSYSVSVLTQPFGQECTVNSGAGTANADVGSIDIQCITASYSVGGSIVGLGGVPEASSSILGMRNNGELIYRSASGNFSFPTRVAHNGSYNVTIATQPIGQICTVGSGSGTVSGAPITSVSITCERKDYSLGYIIEGLQGEMDLANNGNQHTVLDTDLAGTFPGRVLHGSSYNVYISRQPPEQTCVVENGTGVATADIGGADSIRVKCSFQVTVTAPQPRQLNFAWLPHPSHTRYRLWKDLDGTGPLPEVQVGSDLLPGSESATDELSVHAHDWINARYRVEICAPTCRFSVPLNPVNQAINAIGYFKAWNSDADDRFGTAIAMSADGNTLVVGAPGESSDSTSIHRDADPSEQNNNAPRSGAVYVFVRQGATWVRQAYLKASNADIQDAFGGAVAISADGNYIAVGAPGESSGSLTNKADDSVSNAGAVYVFNRNGTVWTEQAYIKASNPLPQTFFGGTLFQSFIGITLPGRPIALSRDGSVLVVGASGHAVQTPDETDAPSQNEGAAYVFNRIGTDWSQEIIIRPTHPDTDDIFGHSVAIAEDGNLIAVSAPLEDGAGRGINQDASSDGSTNSGAAYVYLRTGSVWTETYLKPLNTLANQSFGQSVALSEDGNTLVVSAMNESSSSVALPEDESSPNSGALYVFARNGGLWAQEQRLKANPVLNGYQLGLTVALSADGNLIAAGTTADDSASRGVLGDITNTDANNSGGVLMFRRGPVSWEQGAYLKSPNTNTSDIFGVAVTLSGDGSVLAVGASQEDGVGQGVNPNSRDDNSLVQSGAVYLY